MSGVTVYGAKVEGWQVDLGLSWVELHPEPGPTMRNGIQYGVTLSTVASVLRGQSLLLASEQWACSLGRRHGAQLWVTG